MRLRRWRWGFRCCSGRGRRSWPRRWFGMRLRCRRGRSRRRFLRGWRRGRMRSSSRWRRGLRRCARRSLLTLGPLLAFWSLLAFRRGLLLRDNHRRGLCVHRCRGDGHDRNRRGGEQSKTELCHVEAYPGKMTEKNMFSSPKQFGCCDQQIMIRPDCGGHQTPSGLYFASWLEPTRAYSRRVHTMSAATRDAASRHGGRLLRRGWRDVRLPWREFLRLVRLGRIIDQRRNLRARMSGRLLAWRRLRRAGSRRRHLRWVAPGMIGTHDVTSRWSSR